MLVKNTIVIKSNINGLNINLANIGASLKYTVDTSINDNAQHKSVINNFKQNIIILYIMFSMFLHHVLDRCTVYN